MGFPVNVAARLQNATKELNNNLIVSKEVFDLLHTPIAGTRKSITLKGVKNPLTVYLVGKSYK